MVFVLVFGAVEFTFAVIATDCTVSYSAFFLLNKIHDRYLDSGFTYYVSSNLLDIFSLSVFI